MERIIRLGSAAPRNDPSAPFSGARMRNQHLWLSAGVVSAALGDPAQVYAAFDPAAGALLLAPMGDAEFKAAHTGCALLMLKLRNPEGDRSVSMQEMILDHGIDAADRDLPWEAAAGAQRLTIRLTEPAPDA